MQVDQPFNKEANVCLECGGSITLLKEKGDSVCNNCGLIISEKNIDNSRSGARYFSQEEMTKKVSTGPPQNNLSDINLITRIKPNTIKNPDLKRAVKQNNHLDWHQKNLITAANEIKRITSDLRLPDYLGEASMVLYKKYLKNSALNGRSISGMVAACLYFICRVNKISRSLKEISVKTSLNHDNQKEVYNCYKALLNELNLKSPPPDPTLCVPRFISDLGLNQKVESPTIKVIRAFSSRGCSAGKDPRGVAAGALYLVCKMINVKTNQKEIAKVANITHITLCKRYKEIVENLFEREKRFNKK